MTEAELRDLIASDSTEGEVFAPVLSVGPHFAITMAGRASGSGAPNYSRHGRVSYSTASLDSSACRSTS
jgi:hypothetical protein